MDRMREKIGHDMANIKEGLTHTDELDFYQEEAEFIAPYTLKVGKEKIKGKMILLCTGSKPHIPPINGVDKVKYHTSDTILGISKLPKSIGIIGGGFIAAEYGHFFTAMGSEVTIIGRNPQFLPQEEPEVSYVASKELSKRMNLYTNYEVKALESAKDNKKLIIAEERKTKERLEIPVDEVLIATGRSSNSDILHPEKSDVKTDKNGWIIVDDYLQTTKENIWAFGDANGKFLLKHVANYESQIVYYNAIRQQKLKADYHAIPHAVFTDPEVASVGMKEEEAIKEFGLEKILIGFQRYQNTAKGLAMEVEDFFVKIIVNKDNMTILGAHIVGPHASVLIQEIINLMYTDDGTIIPLMRSMHIHPALNEVVDRAAGNLMPVEHYHHFLKEVAGIDL